MEQKRTTDETDAEEDSILGKNIKKSKIIYEESNVLINLDSFSPTKKNNSDTQLQSSVGDSNANSKIEWLERFKVPTSQHNKTPEQFQELKEQKQIQQLEEEQKQFLLKIKSLEEVICKQKLKMEKERYDLEKKVEELENRCIDYQNEYERLRNENYIQENKIKVLEDCKLEQMKLSCGPVFHCRVVFKGTDIVVPCECIKDYFSMLPDEIILKIFRMLPRSSTMLYCAPTCKRWNRLCCDSSLWKEVNLDQKAVKVSTIAKLVACGVEYLSLHSAKLDNQGQSFLNSLPFQIGENPRFSKLKYLDLSDTAIEANTLQELLSVCSHLKYLSLYYIFKIPIHDIICRHIAANKDLQELNLGSVLGFTSLGILDICTSCAKLEILNLTWTYLTEETIDIISSNLPSSVTTLSLNGNKEFQDSHIQRIVERCPNIIKLNIPCCFRLTSAIIDFIVSGLQNIQHLDISYNKHILPEKLFFLKDAKSLEELVIDHFEEEEDAIFLSNLKNLLPNVRIFSN